MKLKGDRDFQDLYQKYLSDLRNEDLDVCPSAELLSRYYNKDLPRKQMRAIEEHVDLCPFCLAALERLQKAEETILEETALPENWPEIEKVLNKNFYTYLESAPRPLKKKMEVFERKNYLQILKEKWQDFSEAVLTPRSLVYAGALAVLVIVSLYSYAYFNRGKYFYLAQLEPERQSVLRSEITAITPLAEGLRLFDEGNYQRSIIKLKASLKENPRNYAANYYLGLSYLFNAQEGLPGLSYKFDDSQVEAGINYLEKALLLSEENQFYQEDCYWYLGKAFLMKGDLEKAREQFSKILNLSQPNLMRKDKAREMILKLD